MSPSAFATAPRILALAALLSLGIFLLAAASMHALRPELDWVHSQMSVYLVGAWGWLLQSADVALAVGMLALGVGLYLGLPPPARSGAPVLLFAIGAPALVVTALAPMRFPWEEQRLEHLVHGIAAQTTFLCATGGMVLQALRLRLDAAWRPISRMALAWALLCFVGVWVLAFWRELPRGLAQKGLIAMIVAWLGVVAAWQIGLARRAAGRA